MYNLPANDHILVDVCSYIQEGWPNLKNQCSHSVAPYWGHFSNLTVLFKGLMMLGDRTVIPKKLLPEILERIHQGHCGIEKCK